MAMQNGFVYTRVKCARKCYNVLKAKITIVSSEI